MLRRPVPGSARPTVVFVLSRRTRQPVCRSLHLHQLYGPVIFYVLCASLIVSLVWNRHCRSIQHCLGSAHLHQMRSGHLHQSERHVNPLHAVWFRNSADFVRSHIMQHLFARILRRQPFSIQLQSSPLRPFHQYHGCNRNHSVRSRPGAGSDWSKRVRSVHSWQVCQRFGHRNLPPVPGTLMLQPLLACSLIVLLVFSLKPGQYSTAAGATACKECVPGSSQPTAGQSYCVCAFPHLTTRHYLSCVCSFNRILAPRDALMEDRVRRDVSNVPVRCCLSFRPKLWLE